MLLTSKINVSPTLAWCWATGAFWSVHQLNRAASHLSGRPWYTPSSSVGCTRKCSSFWMEPHLCQLCEILSYCSSKYKITENKNIFIKNSFVTSKQLFFPSLLFPITRHQSLLSMNYILLSQIDFFIMLLWKKFKSWKV